MFESIEGKRGEPRNKPPFPVQVGLFGKPTVVNNVETLANIPQIVLEGGAAFAAIGTRAVDRHATVLLVGKRRSAGCVRGGVRHEAARADRPGRRRRRKAAPSARCCSAARPARSCGRDEIDLRLTHEDTRAAGTTLGSGVVMVIDDTVDLRDSCERIAAFFRDESCGQCVPCRVGTIRQEEALHRIGSERRAALAAELALLDEVGAAMKDASICGLGQTAYRRSSRPSSGCVYTMGRSEVMIACERR